MATAGGLSKDSTLLNVTIPFTIDLLNQFESSLLPPAQPSSTTTTNRIQQEQPSQNPYLLTTLRQCATVIKAHTTKLSLLIITEPFTPSAVEHVLRDLSTGALPTLISAAQACTAANWGKTFHDEVKSRTRRVLWELKGLLNELSARGTSRHDNGSSKGKIAKGKANGSRDEVLSAGVIWEACDRLVELEKDGIAGVVAAKAQEYYDMLEDAIVELKEWGGEEDGGDDDGEHEGDEHVIEPPGKQDEDLLFEPTKKLSKDDKAMRDQLEMTTKKLDLVKLIYRPVIKRRLKKFPAPSTSLSPSPLPLVASAPPPSLSADPPKAPPSRSPSSNETQVPSNSTTPKIDKLDQIMQHLQELQSETDELAVALYELDGKKARELLDRCVHLASRAGALAEMSWLGEADEFTAWVRKWRALVGRQGVE